MRKNDISAVMAVSLFASLFLAGCVERQLTINTKPQEALVALNDEEIGTSPVTVSFEWYGDYNVRISKEGYETLATHRKLKAPWYDRFPFDFFALLTTRRVVDSYEWTFTLEEKKQIDQEQLIEDAVRLKKEALSADYTD